jgi:hypothetical protein
LITLAALQLLSMRVLMNTYKNFAPALVELGYDTTPVSGKAPILNGWQTRPAAALEFDQHAEKSIGVLLGGLHNLIAVDVDVMNPFAANSIEKLIDDILGSGPRRVGKAPKFLMVFKTDRPMRKIKTAVFDIEACDDDGCVEVLAEGQQFVASGIHPDTLKKYEWPGDSLLDFAAADLPTVAVDDVVRFIEAANNVLAQFGTPKRSSRGGGSVPPRGLSALNLKELKAAVDEIEEAMSFIPNEDVHYDDWVHMAHAIKGALGEAGRDIFFRWSARSSKNDVDQNERVWRSIGDVTRVGAGSIFYMADRHGFDLSAHRRSKCATAATTSMTQFDPKTGEIIDDDDDQEPFKIGRMVGFNPRSIKPRRWIIDGRYIRGKVTLTIAPPGVGKSTLTMMEALAVAAGQDFAGRETKIRGRVWIYNNEDDEEELHRRLVAAAKSMRINLADIEDRLFVNSGETQPLLIAREGDRPSETIITDHVDHCVRHIRENKIDLILVDPLVETHTVSENANDAMNRVARAFRQIAQFGDCAVSLVHHSRKVASGDTSSYAGNADTSRGASSIVGVARVAQTIYPMTRRDADKYNIDDQNVNRYVRLDDAKANLSLVSAEATWFERQAEFVPHGALGLSGDWVGVLKHVDLKPDEEAETERREGYSALLRAAWQHVDEFDETTVYTVARRLAWSDAGEFHKYRVERADAKTVSNTLQRMLKNAAEAEVQWASEGVFCTVAISPDGKKLCRKKRGV